MAHMKNAEKEENVINDSLPNVRPQSERLYSLLTGLMKQRPLRLVRGVSSQNGLEAWRILTIGCSFNGRAGLPLSSSAAKPSKAMARVQGEGGGNATGAGWAARNG